MRWAQQALAQRRQEVHQLGAASVGPACASQGAQDQQIRAAVGQTYLGPAYAKQRAIGTRASDMGWAHNMAQRIKLQWRNRVPHLGWAHKMAQRESLNNCVLGPAQQWGPAHRAFFKQRKALYAGRISWAQRDNLSVRRFASYLSQNRRNSSIYYSKHEIRDSWAV